ncbi:unnamed protein product [Allacma fusca]|uniref:Uncharacterized protein n=1 Tax=Allacma fusca TaxID=39272 RepID=A0A8J2JNY7_9HEXA|nr:unnamed protein product [Allacma fusca]
MKSPITLLLACLLEIALTENVTYHVWNNPIPEKVAGVPGQVFSVPKGSTFGDVMNVAAEQNPTDYRYTYIQYDFGRLFTGIGGVSQDPGNNRYWVLFKLSEEPKAENPPGNKNLTEYGADGTFVENNDIFLFWLTNGSHSSKV